MSDRFSRFIWMTRVWCGSKANAIVRYLLDAAGPFDCANVTDEV